MPDAVRHRHATLPRTLTDGPPEDQLPGDGYRLRRHVNVIGEVGWDVVVAGTILGRVYPMIGNEPGERLLRPLTAWADTVGISRGGAVSEVPRLG